MINPPADEKTLKAIHRLQFNEDMLIYTEYLIHELSRLRADNDHAEGVQLFRQQGAAQTLSALVLQGETVREALHKLAKQPRQVANLPTRRP